MFHIKGDLHEKFSSGEENVFSNHSSILAIAHQNDNTSLFYSKIKNPSLRAYFKTPRILKYKHWNPAFNIEGSNLLEFQQATNLYVIGDNNICGIEDAFIYGVYAANHIIKNNSFSRRLPT